MNIKEAIIAACRFTECDGLYNPETACGCDINDLMPCGEPSPECELGYKSTHSKTGQWVIADSPSLSDNKILGIIQES